MVSHLSAEEWQLHGRTGPSLRLEHLLTQLAGRAGEAAGTQARMRGLLAAVIGVAHELNLPVTLRKIVEAACALSDAEFGALGVIGPEGSINELIHVGSDADVERAGRFQEGDEPPGTAQRQTRTLPAGDAVAQPEAFDVAVGRPVTTAAATAAPTATATTRAAAMLNIPIMIRGETFGTLHVGGKRGGATFTRDDEDMINALASAVGFAIENARLHEQTRQRQAWLAANLEITTALLSATEPERALQLVACRARQVTSAALAAVLVPAEPGTLSVAVAEVASDGPASSLRKAPLAGRVIPVGGRPGSRARLEEAMDSGRAALVTEAPAELFGDPDLDMGLGTTMVVPLVAAGRSLGLLVIGMRPGTTPRTGLDLEMATAFAGHAALALELSRVQRDRERLAVLDDRGRIARDLHDIVIQRLFATGLQLQGLSRLVEGSSGERMAAAAGELDQTIADIRRTVFSLTSPTGEEVELRAKILEIVQHAEHHLGLRPTVRIEGAIERGVPEPIHPHLLAALREALANTARHARATRTQVLVRVTADEVLVEVRDNGCGPGGASRRSGLTNLRRRALDLGGYMDFGPGADGTGTTVTWRVPASPVDCLK